MGCGSSVPHKSGFTSSAVSEKEAPPTPLLVGNGERDGSGWKGSDHAGRKYTKEEDNAALPSSSPKAVARDKTPSPKAFRDRRLSKELPSDVSPSSSPYPTRTFRNRRLSKDEESVHKGKKLAELGALKENAVIATDAAAAAGKILLVLGAACLDQEPAIVSPRDALTSRASVGAYSCHGMEPIDGPGAEATSRNKINQDAACVAHALGGDETGVLLCVYDGHGVAGETVSKQVLESIHYELDTRCTPAMLHADPAATLAAAFQSTQDQLAACAAEEPVRVDATESGACALVAYLRERKLWVANAGDCCCVLATQQARESESSISKFTARKLCTEHKCDVLSEQRRIEGYGGFVKTVEYEDGEMVAPARFYEDADERWKGPGLAIARSIGDLSAVRCGLVATPEVTSHALLLPSAAERGGADAGVSCLCEHDAFLILASDGVWEFFTPQAAIDIVAPFYRSGERALDACKTLIKMAAHRKYSRTA